MKGIVWVMVLACSLYSCGSPMEVQRIGNPFEESEKRDIQQLYSQVVVPLFSNYEDVIIPDSLSIDFSDQQINAGAAFNYIEISQGLADLDDRPIQLFALAHEVAHIVTLTQAEVLGLKGPLSKGRITNEYKKGEYLADLIAIHQIAQGLPNQFKELMSDMEYLEAILDGDRFTHPTGEERIESIKKYLEQENLEDSFENRFMEIWEMP